MSASVAAQAANLLGARIGVVVSGGAPTLHLAAGALCGFYERGLSFRAVAAA